MDTQDKNLLNFWFNRATFTHQGKDIFRVQSNFRNFNNCMRILGLLKSLGITATFTERRDYQVVIAENGSIERLFSICDLGERKKEKRVIFLRNRFARTLG